MSDSQKECPNCNQAVAADAVICIDCGYNFKTGQIMGRTATATPPELPSRGAAKTKPKETPKKKKKWKWVAAACVVVFLVLYSLVSAGRSKKLQEYAVKEISTWKFANEYEKAVALDMGKCLHVRACNEADARKGYKDIRGRRHYGTAAEEEYMAMLAPMVRSWLADFPGDPYPRPVSHLLQGLWVVVRSPSSKMQCQMSRDGSFAAVDYLAGKVQKSSLKEGTWKLEGDTVSWEFNGKKVEGKLKAVARGYFILQQGDRQLHYIRASQLERMAFSRLGK